MGLFALLKPVTVGGRDTGPFTTETQRHREYENLETQRAQRTAAESAESIFDGHQQYL